MIAEQSNIDQETQQKGEQGIILIKESQPQIQEDVTQVKEPKVQEIEVKKIETPPKIEKDQHSAQKRKKTMLDYASVVQTPSKEKSQQMKSASKQVKPHTPSNPPQSEMVQELKTSPAKTPIIPGDPGTPTPLSKTIKKNKSGSKKKKSKRERVSSYCWIYYDLDEDKEIDYMRDFYDQCEGKKMNKKKLGLDTEYTKKKTEEENPKNLKVDDKNQKKPLQAMNSSSKKVLDVTNNLLERLMKYGRLDDVDASIKRRQHSNDNFYVDDEFINDPQEKGVNMIMEQIESEYSDYFMIEGDENLFEKSREYQERMNEINYRNKMNKKNVQEKHRQQLKKRNEQNELKMLLNTNLSELKDKVAARNEAEENRGMVQEGESKVVANNVGQGIEPKNGQFQKQKNEIQGIGGKLRERQLRS